MTQRTKPRDLTNAHIHSPKGRKFIRSGEALCKTARSYISQRFVQIGGRSSQTMVRAIKVLVWWQNVCLNAFIVVVSKFPLQCLKKRCPSVGRELSSQNCATIPTGKRSVSGKQRLKQGKAKLKSVHRHETQQNWVVLNPTDSGGWPAESTPPDFRMERNLHVCAQLQQA